MTKGWDAGRYVAHRTVDELRFLADLGTHAPTRGQAPERIKRLMAGYRASMAWRHNWGEVNPWAVREYLEGGE